MALQHPDSPTTSILLIDGNAIDRTYFADHLKRCTLDYRILEAADGQSGLDLYRSQQVECVVLDLELPDQSGFKILLDLIPIARRPTIAVVVLTREAQPGMRELALKSGAQAYLVKQFTSGDELARSIQRAIAHVGMLPKEDRY